MHARTTLDKTNLKVLVLVLGLIPSLAMNGQCDLIGTGPGGGICTTEVVASVKLTVTDADGEPVPAATISFTIDGTDAYIGGCNGDCEEVVLAYEIVGRFDIEVGGFGFVSVSESVDVASDEAGCHPVTEEVGVVLEHDQTVGVLHGAWHTINWYGQSVLRFGAAGEIIGAILYDQTSAGDGNFYLAYNNHAIRGVAGQQIFYDIATDPIRVGNALSFTATTPTIPIGFHDASLSADHNTLAGMLSGAPVTYTRLAEIPEPLQDP